MKFLKRDKGKEPDLEFENLDIPPAPPNLGEKDIEELPELPELPKSEKFFSKTIEEPSPKLEVPSEKISSEEFPTMPEFPEPDIEPEITEQHKPMFGMQELEEEKLMEMPKPMPSVEAPKPRLPEIKPYERLERATVREDQGIARQKNVKGPIFVSVGKFREVITEISSVKGQLRIVNQSFLKLNDMDISAESSFKKWHSIMTDIQKKFIYIDKTFFKGGGR